MLSPPRMSYLSPLHPHHHLSYQATLQGQAQSALTPSLIPQCEGLSPHRPEAPVFPSRLVTPEGGTWALSGSPGSGTQQAWASAWRVREKEAEGTPAISQPLAHICFSGGGTLPWLRAALERREVRAHAPQGPREGPQEQLLPGAALAPRCPAGPASPWPSSGASALWVTPSPAHSARASGQACACTRSCVSAGG